MRFAGAAEAARGYGPHDHLCWAYEDTGQLRLRAAEFLADGLRQNQQVYYVSAGDTDGILDALTELADAEHAVRVGTLRLLDLYEIYDASGVIDPRAQVAAYAAATAKALAGGHTGLRVAADATPLVRTADHLDAFTRYEHLVDRYMVNHRFSALCAYNRDELGDDVVAQLAAVHPSSTPGAAPFRLHAVTRHQFALSGELDLSTRELLRRTLGRVDIRPGRVVIDAADLTFADHQSLLALDEFARDRGLRVALVGVPNSGIRRCVELLGLTAVRVEPAA